MKLGDYIHSHMTTQPTSWTCAVEVHKHIKENIFDQGLLDPSKLEYSSVLDTKSSEYSRITEDEWYCLAKRAATDYLLEKERIGEIKGKGERNLTEKTNVKNVNIV